MTRRGHRRYPRMTALSLASACLAGILVPNGTFAGTRHAVTIDGMRYIPESIEVRPGDVISWTNQDPFPHTVTFDSPGSDSKEIPAAGQWTMTATANGRYTYRCRLHPTMHGALVVK